MTTKHADLLVLGAGPGGYAAAFYAAEFGSRVILVDKGPNLGGVCLNRGCIPSKALLHATHIIDQAKESSHFGISFDKPSIDLDKLREWKNAILSKLSSGVSQLANGRKVEVIIGRGHFEGDQTLRVETDEGQQFITYDKAILAVGSRPALPSVFDLGSKRVMTSTEALDIPDIPKKLLVVGGGYIGMELGFVYSGLGSQVTVVEAMKSILTGADPDLVRPVMKKASERFDSIQIDSKVKKISTKNKQIEVIIDNNGDETKSLFDKVLVSIGRTPNSQDLGLENTSVKLDDKGYVCVNSSQQTDDSHIYAIGDIAGGLLLAHKASKEAKIAVEVIHGQPTEFNDVIIPAVVFTDPEVAWCGLTEIEAKEKKIAVEVIKFPWGASGRALTLGQTDGLTKLIVHPDTHRILGVGIVGPHAGDLISEGVLAIEMQATVEDLAETVHPHPTLSETLFEAAEAFLGHSAHMISKKRK